MPLLSDEGFVESHLIYFDTKDGALNQAYHDRFGATSWVEVLSLNLSILLPERTVEEYYTKATQITEELGHAGCYITKFSQKFDDGTRQYGIAIPKDFPHEQPPGSGKYEFHLSLEQVGIFATYLYEKELATGEQIEKAFSAYLHGTLQQNISQFGHQVREAISGEDRSAHRIR